MAEFKIKVAPFRYKVSPFLEIRFPSLIDHATNDGSKEGIFDKIALLSMVESQSNRLLLAVTLQCILESVNLDHLKLNRLLTFPS